MVLCRGNGVVRNASSRLVSMQFSASLQYDSLWRFSRFQAATMGPGSIVFTSHVVGPCCPISKPPGHVSVPASRGGLLLAGRASVFQQPWDRRGEIYLQGARWMGIFSVVRWFRKTRRRSALRKAAVERELELDVKICIEEELPRDDEILNTAEILRLNVPMAMKVAFDGLKDSTAKTRDTAIDDLGTFSKVELSVLLCNDDFMRKLNKEWRDEDHSTDVLSMSQHIPGFEFPILMLGDIVISVDTAARQAEERGHSLLDEIRILMVHGLLHLLGYDHEKGEEAEIEMENEEEVILRSLGWKGKGLIHSTYKTLDEDCSLLNISEEENGTASMGKDPGVEIDHRRQSVRLYQPKFKYVFCDLDGTLLNSKGQVTPRTADALRESISRGVKIMIATGRTRPAAISALKMVDLVGENGVVSKFSPGVFIQGLLVYGKQGREIYKGNLDPNVCKEAFLFSLEHQVPLVGFSQDRSVTLFDHPLVDALHSVYFEPKAEVMPSIEHLLSTVDVQKLLFYDTAENVKNSLRPHWSLATEGCARVVQSLPEMLEILPAGASKGDGIRILLEHLGVKADEVMAIGDGENDMEMLDLACLGVVMANGSDKAKAVADVVVTSNDEDGVADAIYRYLF